MLPRCARALEIDYSTIAANPSLRGTQMDCSSQEGSIDVLANFGFGLRILPVYAKSLLKEYSTDWTAKGVDGEREGPEGDVAADGSNNIYSYKTYSERELYRRLHGEEPAFNYAGVINSLNYDKGITYQNIGIHIFETPMRHRAIWQLSEKVRQARQPRLIKNLLVKNLQPRQRRGISIPFQNIFFGMKERMMLAMTVTRRPWDAIGRTRSRNGYRPVISIW